MPFDGDCTVTFPLNPDIVCAYREHPHRVSHRAAGQLPDGTRWSVSWWDPTLALDDPEGSANHPRPGEAGRAPDARPDPS